MYLKSLEIQGFKSFADKTRLEFGPGITCIVGPNGSGKSNICDAIRWVLGEQSLKTLRGSKLEDIIFSGSEGRRPLGMASVTLVFDNSSGLLPLEFSEVTVSRRVFRSGDSEFYINKTPCRLKDIHELFHDTGLGKEAFAIIGQGQVDAILSSRPEERRSLFEEAAGIVRYRNRKMEASKKLEHTSANLERLQDLLFELEQNLVPLAEEARKAQKYQELSRELEMLEISLSCLAIERIAGTRQKVAEEKSQLENILWEKESHHGLLTTRLEELALEHQQLKEKEGTQQSRLYRLEQELNNNQGQMVLAKDRIASLEERQEVVQKEKELNKSKLEQLHLEYEKQQQHFDTLTGTYEAMKKKLAEREQKLAACQKDLALCQATANRLKDDLFDMEQHLISSNNACLEIQYELKNLKLQEQKLSEREKAFELRKEELKENLATIARELTLHQEQLDHNQRHYRQANIQKAEAEGRITALQEQLKQLGQQKQASYSRCKVLEDMKENLEGYHAGIRSLLKVGSKTGHFKVIGVVGELLDVPSQYEKAVETALGGAIQFLVTATDREAQKAIDWLKQEKAGRATFLPLNTLKPRPLPREFDALLTEDGVLGLASELVKIAPGQEVVLNYLLGNVLVAKDLDVALSIAKKSGFAVKIVTLDGEVIFPGGSLTGGSHKTKGTRLLSRSREIAQEKRKLKTLTDQEQALLEKLDKENLMLSHLRQQEEQLKERQSQIELEIRNLKKEQERLLQDLSREEQEFQLESWEKEQLHANRKALQEKLALLEQDQEKSRQEKDQLLKEIEEAALQEASLLETIERLSALVTEDKIQLASLKEQLKSAEISLNHLGGNYQELVQKDQDLEEELVQLNQRKEALLASLSGLKEMEIKLQQEWRQLKNDQQSIAAEIQETGEQLRELQQETGQLAKELKELKEQHHQLEMQKTRLDVEWDNALNRLTEKFQLTWEQAQERRVPLPSRGQAETKIKTLKKEIDDLGLVNPNALAEYQRLKERYDFLVSQQKDLLKAREGLFQVIDEMEKNMSLRFKETFQAVEKAFQETFAYLFNGGKATIELTSPDNILESGIEIIAQPPGKKMQNLSLLSGGERALTATALLFALLTVKPSPFCVLDEIEANLDEANVDRFASYLRKFVDRTQFILISHRQGTMEVADALYGVTMEKSGVSRIVSVKLTTAGEVS